MWDVMPFCLHWLVALSTHRSAAVIREPCTPAGRSVSRLAVQRKESAARAENRKSYVILQPVEWAPSARGNRTLQYRVTTTVENVARHMSLGVAPVPSTLFQVFISSRLKQGFSSRVAVNNCADVAQPKISSKRIVPSCVICRVGLKGQCKGLGRDGVGGGWMGESHSSVWLLRKPYQDRVGLILWRSRLRSQTAEQTDDEWTTSSWFEWISSSRPFNPNQKSRRGFFLSNDTQSTRLKWLINGSGFVWRERMKTRAKIRERRVRSVRRFDGQLWQQCQRSHTK